MWSSFVNSVTNKYNAIRIFPAETPPIDMGLGPPNSAYDDRPRQHRPREFVGYSHPCRHNKRISRRTSLDDDTITLCGWPSRGGIIVLENATPPDFDFLHLNALDPPLRRDPDQTAEDAFCQALLRLGATWWDSEARRRFVNKLEYGDEKAHNAVEADESLTPSPQECGWVRVAWPLDPPGALCVLACERAGGSGDGEPRPSHYGVISLARTMDERCDVLRRLGGTMYASIDEYRGPTFLKAWEEHHQGEKGPLFREEFINPSIYGGHPDEALGMFNTGKVAGASLPFDKV